MKLYLPYGTFGPANNREHRRAVPGGVVFHWFVVGRQEPVAPYPSLIMGHRTLLDAVRIRAERTVDEFFSESEFHQLRAYLTSEFGQDVRTAMLFTPVLAIRPDTSGHLGTLRPFYPFGAEIAGTDSNHEVGLTQKPEAEGVLYRLSETKGYPLPFTVWGCAAPLDRPGRFARALAPAAEAAATAE